MSEGSPELRKKTNRPGLLLISLFMRNIFFISFGSQGPTVWRKRGRTVICGVKSSAGSGPLDFGKSSVRAGILEPFTLHSADKLYEEADVMFQLDLVPTHTAEGNENEEDERHQNQQ